MLLQLPTDLQNYVTSLLSLDEYNKVILWNFPLNYSSYFKEKKLYEQLKIFQDDDKIYFNNSEKFFSLPLLKYIHEQKLIISKEVLNLACSYSSLNIVMFLHYQMNIKFNDHSFYNACNSGNIQVVSFLYYSIKNIRIDSISCIETACCNNYVNVVKFLHYIVGIPCDATELYLAIMSGALNVVKFICIDLKHKFIRQARQTAIHYGRHEIVNFLDTL